MSRKRTITASFGYAWDGVKEAFVNEPNFRIHVIITILICLAGFYLKISKAEWLAIILTITIVVVLELINTAIEAVVDIASPKISKLAKIAKDVSAAAVLISSLAAVAIGLLVFLPKLNLGFW